MTVFPPSITIWEQEALLCQQDVIIVGGGFCGLWSAIHLAQLAPKLRITLVDRSPLPLGASTRNAGFSCFGSPSELLHDRQQLGDDALWNLVEMRFKGLARINEYFPASVTDFDGLGGHECFASNSTQWESCAEHLPELNKAMAFITGIPHTFSIASELLPSLGLRHFKHLIRNSLEGGLHSGKLLSALWQAVQQLGVRIITGLPVHAITQQANGVILDTEVGPWAAKQVLLCTNAFTKQLIPNIDIQPARGQVLVTEPIPNFALKGTFHAEEGYYYFRNLGNRLLLGGARHTSFETEATTELTTTEQIQETLENYARRHILPEDQPIKISHRWSGIMAMGSSKFPVVEQISASVFTCVRMSGMGVALAPIVSEQIVLRMLSAAKQ